MRNFPTELLPQIFNLLPQEDQFECMLTCQLWKEIIEQFCLFRTLRIYTSDFLQKITTKIQKHQDIGRNVDKLIIQRYQVNEINLTGFLDEFPNLRNLCYYGSIFAELAIDNWAKFPWYKHIESIEESTTGSIVSHLLSTRLCPNLTSLMVCDEENALIPLLKNAPSLRRLALDSGDIGFNDINQIHETLPHLKTLELSSKWITPHTFNEHITPNYSVTELNLNWIHFTDLETHIELLQFIPIKYPNLVEFTYRSYYEPGTDEDRVILNTNGWLPLLQKLGLQLKKLNTHYEYEFSNLIEKLDEYDCQIHHLKINVLLEENFPYFIQSQQALYIRTLVLDNVTSNSIGWLKELKVLENLELHFRPSSLRLRIDFNDLIDKAPLTLTSLNISDVSFRAEVISTRQTSIKNLTFFKCNLPPKLAWFIDRHCPLLSNLKLKHCQNHQKHFELKSAELELFCLVDTVIEEPICVRVRTLHNDGDRYYFTREQECFYQFSFCYQDYDESDLPPVKSIPADDIKINPYLTLSCHSVQKVVLSK